ncbi:MAG: hypothetical protein ACI9U6_003737, partial [Loktanella salsilacus]
MSDLLLVKNTSAGGFAIARQWRSPNFRRKFGTRGAAPPP